MEREELWCHIKFVVLVKCMFCTSIISNIFIYKAMEICIFRDIFNKEETRGLAHGRRRQLRTKNWSLLWAVVLCVGGGVGVFFTRVTFIHVPLLSCAFELSCNTLGGCCPIGETLSYICTRGYIVVSDFLLRCLKFSNLRNTN